MPSETIPALLADRLADSADVQAIVEGHGGVTYAELDARSAQIASGLVRLGVNKGHRTALLMANGADWAAVAYAVMRIGAVLVPLSTLLRPPELQQQLATAGVRHLISCESHRGRDYRADISELDRDALPSLTDVWWWSQLQQTLPAPGPDAMVAALEQRVRPADDLVIMFTSGSMGAPKGVIHTHGNAIRAVTAALEVRCVRPGCRLYMPMPFFWMGGFGSGLLSTLAAGATLLTEESPEPGQTLRFLERERVTLFRGWPDQALQISRHPDFASTDLSSLQPGSLEAVLPADKRAAAPGRRAGLFGMTETFGPNSGWALDEDMPQAGWGSFGKPLDGVRIRIADPDTGDIAPPDTVGTIQIGGLTLMRGICGRERETVFTPDGWYDTGDLGRLNDDGFLFFIGRRDDMFKVKGATVYPSEVEQALATIPGVRRAFVTDFDLDGAATVGAAVLLEPGAVLDIPALAEAARSRLSAFKLPARWRILNALTDLPTMSTGKVDRVGFRTLVSNGQAAPRKSAPPAS